MLDNGPVSTEIASTSGWQKVLQFLGRFPLVAALPAYIAGVIWRVLHVYNTHDPRSTVYSDMHVYISTARRISNEAYKMVPIDVTHPPATSWLFSQFYLADPSFYSLMQFQVLISALIPLAVGFLAWVAFDQKAAAWSMAASSGYYYYVEYAGFFLSEIYMMFLIPLIMALYLVAVKAKTMPATIAWAALTGSVLFIAIAFKTVAAPAILGFCGVHWLLTRGPSLRVKTAALATTFVATLPGLYVISQRCTLANRNKFCLGSNKTAADFLLGHYDRIHSLKWTDSQFGSPASQQHGYEHVPQVWFSITDSKQNFETAWDWVTSSPDKALVLSVQHIFDLMTPNAPWPTIWTAEWPLAQAVSYIFVMVAAYPACLLLFDIIRSSGVLGLLRSTEFAILSVLFGVMLGVFIATGEARYRLPYDCVFIVLSVQFYRRMFARRSWGRKAPRRPLAPAVAPDKVASEPSTASTPPPSPAAA